MNQQSLKQSAPFHLLCKSDSTLLTKSIEEKTKHNSHKYNQSNNLLLQVNLRREGDRKIQKNNHQYLRKQQRTNCKAIQDINFAQNSSIAILQITSFRNKISINTINTKQEEQIQRRIKHIKLKIRYFKLKDVSVYILDTIERNKTYLRNYAHFLIPYAILLLQAYSVDRDNSSYLIHLFLFVTKKIVKQNISQQITNRQNFEQYISFFINYKKVTHADVMAYLRKFLENEKQQTQAICPYYYNFFAFAYNKEIVFGGNKKQDLIEYTVDFKHKFYGQEFETQNVVAQIQELELLLVEKYHNKQL